MLTRTQGSVGPCVSWAVYTLLTLVGGGLLPAQTRYATSDSQSGYVHWIDLYDASNTRIDPSAENPPPYSPEKTCGRCHEFQTIAHGWHFNAVDPAAEAGRPGQPWIWSDHRTGTHLPLSYRGWPGTHDPDDLGLSRWQVAAKLGGFLPGGGPGAAAALAENAAAGSAESSAESSAAEAASDRAQITGPLPIDCLLCHHREGSGYSPFEWTAQVDSENFAYAPTAALGLAEIRGNLSRLKELDLTADGAASKLPKVSYDLDRFRGDGKVFIDLVRKPQNGACNYCHTNITASEVRGQRWLHDQDVHLRAGMSCADCHRNGLDHHTVRGFANEKHPAGSLVASLSCQGCHMAGDTTDLDPLARPGRLGAPQPAHRGLPPLHFDKLSCTACHSGPYPQQEVERQLNSFAHRLGDHVKRTGDEYPGIVGPVNLPVRYAAAESEEQQGSRETQYTPHRLMWPSYWGTLLDGQVEVLQPEEVYEMIRRPLKVRRDFTEELAKVSLSLSQRKELLGEDRARVKDEQRTPEERQKVEAAEDEARQQQVEERLAAALTAVEEKYPGRQAVYISGGVGFARDGENKTQILTARQLGGAADPYAWPLAHNVRPARQALGAQGCSECHRDGAPFFEADLSPVALVPTQRATPLKAYSLQKVDRDRLKRWNQVFRGRDAFKWASFTVLTVTCVVLLSALVWNIGNLWRGEEQRLP